MICAQAHCSKFIQKYSWACGHLPVLSTPGITGFNCGVALVMPPWNRTGGCIVDSLIYIGFGLIGFGLAFVLYMLLSGRPEQDE